jgi:PAS domain S-box-containing protein
VATEYDANIRRVAETGAGFTQTDTVPAEDGERTYKTTLFPAQVSNGAVTLIGVISADVTDAVRAEQRYRESEKRWQYALESAGDGLWDWDARTNTVFFSGKWKEMLGYADWEVGNGLEEWESRIHPDDRETTLSVLQEHLDGKTEEYRHEHRLRCKDGRYKWILDRGRVIERDGEGAPVRVIGTHTDLDARKRLEAELAESEAKYRRVMEATSFGFWIVDAGGRIEEANPAYVRMSGYSRDELVGMPVAALDAVESDGAVEDRMRAIRGGGAARFMTEHRRKDGTTYPVAVHANLLEQGSERFFAIIEDVSDQQLGPLRGAERHHE